MNRGVKAVQFGCSSGRACWDMRSKEGSDSSGMSLLACGNKVLCLEPFNPGVLRLYNQDF